MQVLLFPLNWGGISHETTRFPVLIATWSYNSYFFLFHNFKSVRLIPIVICDPRFYHSMRTVPCCNKVSSDWKLSWWIFGCITYSVILRHHTSHISHPERDENDELHFEWNFGYRDGCYTTNTKNDFVTERRRGDEPWQIMTWNSNNTATNSLWYKYRAFYPQVQLTSTHWLLSSPSAILLTFAFFWTKQFITQVTAKVDLAVKRIDISYTPAVFRGSWITTTSLLKKTRRGQYSNPGSKQTQWEPHNG